MGDANNGTLGRHLARRLVQVGVRDVFAVPGDFNLTLLDHLIAEPGLRLVGCCNELNAGYAADGYARARGVGACAVTFTVGGLSVLNAIAGAYSENLPVICIVGGPNSNDYGTNRILHHTIGLPDFLAGAALLPARDLPPGRRQQPRRRARAGGQGHLHGAQGGQARVPERQLQPAGAAAPDIHERPSTILPGAQV